MINLKNILRHFGQPSISKNSKSSPLSRQNFQVTLNFIAESYLAHTVQTWQERYHNSTAT